MALPGKILWADLETFSPVPIKHGTYAYAEQSEIMLFAWAIDNGPVSVWDLTTGAPMPLALKQALIDEEYLIYAHKSGFDRTVFRLATNTNPIIKTAGNSIKRWRCSMTQAMCHGLPGSLDKLCKIFELPEEFAKKAGKNYIQMFCVPKAKKSKLRRYTKDTHPTDWADFVAYAENDIKAMRMLVQDKLPVWNYQGFELDLWHLDQTINDRGFAVDRKLVKAVITEVAREKARLAKHAQDLTDNALQSTTTNAKLLTYILESHGIELPNLQAATIREALKDDNLPWAVRQLLEVRLQASSTSVTKYKALDNAVSSDNRMRGGLQFAGAARTGRWAGRTFQPHNLPRLNTGAVARWCGKDKVDEHDIQRYLDFGVEVLKNDGADLFYDEVMYLCSNLVRGCIVAPEGKRQIVTDLSNIEGRGLVWLSGEEWKLKAFREFDLDPKNKAKDLYNISYARSFNIADPGTVVKDQRQIGKVQELALGYEGGVGAFLTFAAAYNIDLDTLADKAAPTIPKHILDEAEKLYGWLIEQGKDPGLPRKTWVVCDALKRLWRLAHPRTVKMWDEVADAVRLAIRRPGETIECGKLRIRRKSSWLRIILPSGRALCYSSPEVTDGDRGEISYKGISTGTHQWRRIKTYGGKLVENITQAVARDVLAYAMPKFEAAGYKLVLTVHDELVCEVPDTDKYSIERANAMLAECPPWAEGLPLAAAGFETYRYRKD